MSNPQLSNIYIYTYRNNWKFIKVVLSVVIQVEYNAMLESNNVSSYLRLCYDWVCLSHIQPWAPYIFAPYYFLPVKPSEAPVGILRWYCSRGHIRLRAPYGLTRLYTCGFGRIIRRTPHGPRAMPVRASCGPRMKLSNVFISYETRTRPVRDPQGCRTASLQTRKGIDITQISKIPHGRRMWPFGTGPLRPPHGLFTGCIRSLNPYRARKLMPQSHHIPGPRTGCSRDVHGQFWTKIVRPLTGPVRAPCGAVRILLPLTELVEF